MKVSDVEITPVSVPFVEPVPWRYGVARGVTTALITIRTDDGVCGVGEAPGEPTIDVVVNALRALTPLLLGEDPRRVRDIRTRFSRAGAEHFPYVYNIAIAGIEMALLDICGKALGCPVYDLLGGRTNDSIEFYWHVNAGHVNTGADSAAAAGESVLAGLSRGFRTMYLKGSSDIGRDLDLAESVRSKAGANIALRIDPNEGWNALDAHRHVSRIGALNLEFLEQPFAKDDLRSARRFGAEAGVRLAANQSAWLLQDLARVLKFDAADVIVTGIHQCGGLLPLMTAAQMCALGGKPLVRHSLCELGVATAAAVHILAAIPPSGLAHQTHLCLLADDLLDAPWRFDAGQLAVRHSPGLSVRLNPEAVERYSKQYQQFGEYRGYAPLGDQD